MRGARKRWPQAPATTRRMRTIVYPVRSWFQQTSPTGTSRSTELGLPIVHHSEVLPKFMLMQLRTRRPGGPALRRSFPVPAPGQRRRDHRDEMINGEGFTQDGHLRWRLPGGHRTHQHDWHRRLTGTEVAVHRHPVETRHRPHTRTLFRWRPARRAQPFSQRVSRCSSTRVRSGADRSSFPASRYNAAVITQ